MSPAAEKLLLKKMDGLEQKLDRLLFEKSQSKPEYVTLAEASERFSVSERTIQNARWSGKLTDFTYTKNGRNYRYSVSELEKVFAIKNKN